MTTPTQITPFSQPAKPSAATMLKTQYETYAGDPTPDNMSPILQGLTPTIRSVMAKNGLRDDPNIEYEMKAQLAEHIANGYDPEKAALNTYAYDVLKRMPRVAAQQRHGVHIPESADLAKRQVYAATERLKDELNRNPTSAEIADATGLSAKRVDSLDRRYGRAAVSQSFSEAFGGQSAGTQEFEAPELDMWVEATVNAFSPVDRRIYEALSQDEPLTKTQLAKELGVSNAAITQRVGRMVKMLGEIYE